MTSESSPWLTRRSVLARGLITSGALAAGAAGSVSGKPGKGNGKGKKCDSAVPEDHETIQAAVDDADAGDTICIDGGTYEANVSVDTEVTLRGRTAPNSNNPATVDGRISIDAGGEGSTITRLRITASETFEGDIFPDPFGVRVQASDVSVENNVIEELSADLSNGEGSLTLHGVQVFGRDATDVSGVTVRDNVIQGFQSDGDPTSWPKYGGIAAVKAQAGVEDVTITGNEITDHHSAGWVWGVVLTTSSSAPGAPQAVTVEENDISGLNDGSVFDVFAGDNDGRDGAPYPGSAVGIDGGASANEATIRRNNLQAPNGAESKDENDTLVVECNWWGDKSGPTHENNPDGSGTWALERGDATIDYTPWLIAPSPSNACKGGERGNPGSGR